MPSHPLFRPDPQYVLSSWKYRHRTWDRGPCGLRTHGLGPSYGLPAAGVVWAGFDNWDDGGFFCRESIDYVFRGGVQFDLGAPAEGVPDGFAAEYGKGKYMLLQAVLEFWYQEPHGACETYLHLANGDWAGGTLDDYLIPTSPSDYIDTIPPFAAPPDGGGLSAAMIRINVTDYVLSWLAGYRPNYGFCFVGADESMPEGSNDVCVNQFGSFKLELMYLTLADGAGAHHTAPVAVKPRIQRPSETVVRTMVGGRLPESHSERICHPVPRNRRPPQQ